MAGVTIDMVKALREKTQAGMMDCKNALEEAGADMTRAEEILRVKRKTIADKKGATREAGVGVIATYTHGEGRIGSMVELRCETDFVARGEDFQRMLKDLCLQIAASSPLVVERSQMDQDVLDKEREIYAEQMREQGKDEQRIPQIIEGMLEKNFFKNSVLLEQAFVKDPSTSIGDMISDLSGRTGEKVVIRRFARFEV